MDFIFSKSSETCLKMDHYATCSRRGLVFENVCVGLNANVVFIPLIIIVIISSGDEDDPRFSRPHDLDLIQTTGPPMDLLDMKAPPRTLTLSEQPLDSLETEQTPSPQAHVSQGVGRTDQDRVSLVVFHRNDQLQLQPKRCSNLSWF